MIAFHSIIHVSYILHPASYILHQASNILSYPKKCLREKGRDLTQSCDKKPYTHRTIQKASLQFKDCNYEIY